MHKVLLVSPPIYDFRFDWARWHQPCGLLQMGNLLHGESDIRLVDCLQPSNGNRVNRNQLDSEKGLVPLDGVELRRWHFGLSWDEIDRQLQELKDEKWHPNVIYVTCMMTFWWEGARDLIQHLRQAWFPKTRIVLGGIYPTCAPDHARRSIPGVHFDFEIGKRAKRHPTDFDLYQRQPHFAGIFLSRSVSADALVGEIEKKADKGTREFAFFDDEIPGKDPKRFEHVLDLIVERELDIKLRALGNLSPRSLTENLVIKMRAAGYRQIFLKDDVAFETNAASKLGAYEQGVRLLQEEGHYRPRTDDVTAMVLVGVPGEKVENVAERLTRLAHIVGSVNLVPFQPTPGTEIYHKHKEYLYKVPLELQNGKLFPFASYNHSSFSDYQELTRLAALLNSKFHSTTFDFLADDEIAQMVRKSIAQETWQPKLKETIPLNPDVGSVRG